MTEAPAQPSFRDRIGGRWAISWQAFAVTIPFAVTTVVVSTARSWSEVLLWILAGLVGAFAAGIWVVFMHGTVFRHRATQPVPLALALAHPVLTITLAITGTTLASMALGLPQQNGPLSLALPLLTIGTLWSIAIVLLLEARWRFSSERDVLVERAVQQQLAAMYEADVADTIRESLQTEITDQLARTRLSIDKRLATIEQDASQAAAAASDLRHVAQQALRPLSHELAQRTAQTYPRPGISAFLRNILDRQPFRPLAVTLIYLITSSMREFERNGWAGGLIAIGITIALIWLTMSVTNWAMRRWPHRHSSLFIAGIALIEFPSIALQPIKSQITGIPTDWPSTLIAIGFGIVLIFLTSGFGSIRATREDLLRTFATDVKSDEVTTIARSRALAGVAREVAGVLHGPIQTRLVSCAMVIDQAALSGDVEKMNEALHQARTVLEQPLPAPVTDEQVTLTDVVERKAALWRGLVNVTIHVDPAAAAINGPEVQDLGAVVEEGIANAIQHGAATQVTVTIAEQDARLAIRISDNGSGPTGGPRGLGSQMLDRLAPGWRLVPGSRGTCLEAEVRRPSELPTAFLDQTWA